MIDWDGIYTELVTATGWTWEYIDETMTIPRLNGMRKYWESYPPTHISTARLCMAYLDIKPADHQAEEWNPEESDPILASIMG